MEKYVRIKQTSCTTLYYTVACSWPGSMLLLCPFFTPRTINSYSVLLWICIPKRFDNWYRLRRIVFAILRILLRAQAVITTTQQKPRGHVWCKGGVTPMLAELNGDTDPKFISWIKWHPQLITTFESSATYYLMIPNFFFGGGGRGGYENEKWLIHA